MMWKRTGMMTLIGLALALAMSVSVSVSVSVSPAGAQLVDADDRPADDQITRLYRAVFGRDADAGGFEFWTEHYQRTGSLVSVATQFVGSDEFAERYGTNPSNEALVDAMYDNVLGREGDAGGVRFWLEQLESGAMTQIGVLVAFTDSTENIDRTGTSQPLLARDAELLRLYRSAFGRFPDAGGFDFWKGEYTESTSLRDIALRFSQSPEFTDIYGTSPRAAELVDRLYVNVLDRSGDAVGSGFWEGEYMAGRSIPEMLVEFANSPENLAKTGTAANPAALRAMPNSIRFPMVETMSPPEGVCGIDVTDIFLDDEVQGTSPSITATRDDMAFTDLNGDGATDVIVALTCYGGGNAVWSDAFVWIAGETPAPLDFNLHEVVSLRGVLSVATSRTSTDVEPGVVQIEWAGASAIDPGCCPSTRVTTEITAPTGAVVANDILVNGPELNAIRIMTAAAVGGDRPADLPVSDLVWDELTLWMDGSSALVDPSPCFRDNVPNGVTCLFATPDVPVGISVFLYMTQAEPDEAWTATDWEGVIHAT